MPSNIHSGTAAGDAAITNTGDALTNTGSDAQTNTNIGTLTNTDGSTRTNTGGSALTNTSGTLENTGGSALTDIICITNRRLCCSGDLIRQLKRVLPLHPKAVVLREKDLSASDYAGLLEQCAVLCRAYDIPLIAHTFIDAARALKLPAIHLPLPVLLANGGRPAGFKVVGTGVHSANDAKKAIACGADYLFAGHIFETACKEGLPGRGLSFLNGICRLSPVPVYAIGGITLKNMPLCRNAGACGGCMMSELMRL